MDVGTSRLSGGTGGEGIVIAAENLLKAVVRVSLGDTETSKM